MRGVTGSRSRFRNGVNTTGVQRMAFDQAASPQPHAVQTTVCPDGFNHVVRTGRMETAAVAEQRGQHHLVCPDNKDNESADHGSSRCRLLVGHGARAAGQSYELLCHVPARGIQDAPPGNKHHIARHTHTVTMGPESLAQQPLCTRSVHRPTKSTLGRNNAQPPIRVLPVPKSQDHVLAHTRAALREGLVKDTTPCNALRVPEPMLPPHLRCAPSAEARRLPCSWSVRCLRGEPLTSLATTTGYHFAATGG